MTSEQQQKSSASPESEVTEIQVPAGVDRRTFLMRSAVIGATCVITGRAMSAEEQTARATAAAPRRHALARTGRRQKVEGPRHDGAR